MAKRSHPRRGSMAFSPRKRARRPFGHVKSWPKTEASEVRIQGFAGWKAGMTHILARDLNPRSPSAGQETRIPVTVVECPKMRILGVRGYQMTPYGKQAVGEAWVAAEQIADACIFFNLIFSFVKRDNPEGSFSAFIVFLSKEITTPRT